MTDWMAWALVLMVGTFGTIWTTLAELSDGGPHDFDVTTPRRWLIGTIVAGFGVYALYLVFGEAWLPY